MSGVSGMAQDREIYRCSIEAATIEHPAFNKHNQTYRHYNTKCAENNLTPFRIDSFFCQTWQMSVV